MIKQPKLSSTQEALRKSKRYFKHIATMPAKLKARRERIRQAQLMNERINKLAGLALQRLTLDDRQPATDEEKAKLTEVKRQLSREIATLRKTINVGLLDKVFKTVEEVNARRLLEKSDG